jgi:polysaccharide pyruvyl transferase WcaK-like protein
MRRSAVQIFNGLGAGNIGDELMMHGMWRHLPSDLHLLVFLHENCRLQRGGYPNQHQYETVGLAADQFELNNVENMPGLLAGTTSITDVEGWGWPLGFLAPRIQHFADRGLPVDAVGVGVDRLTTQEGRALFQRHFLAIRSWSVRDEAARRSLIELGVSPENIVVGADWAWLFEAGESLDGWAEQFLHSMGIQPFGPLLIVNPFWQGEGQGLPIWSSLASALDRLADEEGLQVAFFCNECRHPGFDRSAAERIQQLMRAPSIVVPNLYFSPGEAIALLRRATVTLGQRYHFLVESVLAGTVAVALGRAPKIDGLCQELSIPKVGSLNLLSATELTFEIVTAIRERDLRRARHASTIEQLRVRALRNLDLLRNWY